MSSPFRGALLSEELSFTDIPYNKRNFHEMQIKTF